MGKLISDTRLGDLRVFARVALACALLFAAQSAFAADVVINTPTTSATDYNVTGNLSVVSGGSLNVTGALNVSQNISNNGLTTGIYTTGNLLTEGNTYNGTARSFTIRGTGASSIIGKLENHGTFNFGNGLDWAVLTVGSLNNVADAHLLFRSNSNLNTTGVLNNAGDVTFEYANFTLGSGKTLNNSGTWSLTQGDYSNQGTTNNATGGVIVLTQGNFVNRAGGTVLNSGNISLTTGDFGNLAGGSLTNQGVIVLSNGWFLTGGATNNQGIISVITGDFGNMTGGTVTNSGSINVVAGDFENQANSTLTNNGSIDITAGNFYNRAGGTMSGNGALNVNGIAMFYQNSMLQGSPTITATLIELQGTTAPGTDGTVGKMTFNGQTYFQNDVLFDLVTPWHPGVGNDLIVINEGGTGTIQSGTQFNFRLPGTSGHIGEKYKIISGNVALTVRPTVTNDDPNDDRRIVLRTDQDITGFTNQGTAYYALIARNTPFEQQARANGGTQGEIAFGRYLDNYIPEDDHTIGTANADLQWFRDTLDLMSTETDMVRSLGEMTGEIYATLNSVALQRQFFAYNQLAGRLREGLFQGCSMDQLDGRVERHEALSKPYVPVESWAPRGWVTGYGFGGAIATNSDATGCTFTGGGVQFACGYETTEELGFGMFYDYGTFNVANDYFDTANAQSHSFGGYLTWHRDVDYFMFVGGGGLTNYFASRDIVLANSDNVISRTTEARSQGGQAAFYGEYGKNFQWENAHLRPYLGVLYMNVLQRQFEETGAGSLDLCFQDSTINSFRTQLGGQFDFRFAAVENVVWTLRSAWMHEFINDAEKGTLIAGLAEVPNSSYVLARPTIGTEWVVAGCGVRGVFCSKHLRPFANYDLVANASHTLHAGLAGLEYVW